MWGLFSFIMDILQYKYYGPVMVFGKCVTNNYTAETTAPTIGKARANVAYRFKKENGLAPNAKVTLPGSFSLLRARYYGDDGELIGTYRRMGKDE